MCFFFRLWDSVALIKVTIARVNARLTSKRNRGVLSRTNRELRLRWRKVNARMPAVLCSGFLCLHLLLARLKQLDDVSHRKLQNLAQHDPDCAAVIKWLRANKHHFRMEIIEPAVVSLTVPNKEYVHAVEACFNITQLKVGFSFHFPLPKMIAVANFYHRRSWPSVTMTTGCSTGS